MQTSSNKEESGNSEIVLLLLGYVALVLSGLNSIVAYRLLRKRKNGNNRLYRLLFWSCCAWSLGMVLVTTAHCRSIGQVAPEVLMLVGNVGLGVGLYLYLLMIIFRFQIVRELRSYNKLFDQGLLIACTILFTLSLVFELSYRLCWLSHLPVQNDGKCNIMLGLRLTGQLIGFGTFVVVDNVLGIALIIIIYQTRRRCRDVQLSSKSGRSMADSPVTLVSSSLKKLLKNENNIKKRTILFILCFMMLNWAGVIIRILSNVVPIKFKGFTYLDTMEIFAVIHLIMLTLNFTLAFKYISQLQLLTQLKGDIDMHSSTITDIPPDKI